MLITIAGVSIPIILQPARKMKKSYGMFIAEEEIIWLLDKQPVHIRRKTLVHEIFHAFLFLTGYNELLASIDEATEEAICRAFEQAMTHFFKFSPELEAWLEGKP